MVEQEGVHKTFTLPSHVRLQLVESRLAGLDPAYLEISHSGRLLDWGGMLARYDIRDLEPGRPVNEQVSFLEGFVPFPEDSMAMPCLQLASGAYADVHLLRGEDRDWIVLLDATPEAERQAVIQQLRNEIQLLREHTAPDESTDAAEGPSLSELCAAIDVLALLRRPNRAFRLATAVPAWARRIFPAGSLENARPLHLGELSPSLAHFQADAEALWNGQRAGQVKSGPWEEVDRSGQRCHLEAAAVSLGSRDLLFIERLGSDHESTLTVLQKARQARLDQYQLLREMEQKEILLHCIVHDLSGPGAGIQGCLELIDKEDLSKKTRELVHLGIKESMRQMTRIRQILEVFAAERQELEKPEIDPDSAPDIVLCVDQVVEVMTPAFAVNNVRLQRDPVPDVAQGWKVVGGIRLERVLFNLLENALRHSPSGAVVDIGVQADAGSVRLTVDDKGPGVPAEEQSTIFDRLSSSRGGSSGKAGLGLYFCRINVERWGGEIAYEPRPRGGSRFWFRLPCVGSPRPPTAQGASTPA